MVATLNLISLLLLVHLCIGLVRGGPASDVWAGDGCLVSSHSWIYSQNQESNRELQLQSDAAPNNNTNSLAALRGSASVRHNWIVFKTLAEANLYCPLGMSISLYGTFHLNETVTFNASRSGASAETPFQVKSLTSEPDDARIVCEMPSGKVPNPIGPEFAPTNCIEFVGMKNVLVRDLSLHVATLTPFAVTAIAVIQSSQVQVAGIVGTMDSSPSQASASDSQSNQRGSSASSASGNGHTFLKEEPTRAGAPGEISVRSGRGFSAGWAFTGAFIAFYGVFHPSTIWQVSPMVFATVFANSSQLDQRNSLLDSDITVDYCYYSSVLYANLQHLFRAARNTFRMRHYVPTEHPIEGITLEMTQSASAMQSEMINLKMVLKTPTYEGLYSDLRFRFDGFLSTFSAISAMEQELTELPIGFPVGSRAEQFLRVNVTAPGNSVQGFSILGPRCILIADCIVTSAIPEAVARYILIDAANAILLSTAGYYQAATNATSSLVPVSESVGCVEGNNRRKRGFESTATTAPSCLIAQVGSVLSSFPPLDVAECNSTVDIVTASYIAPPATIAPYNSGSRSANSTNSPLMIGLLVAAGVLGLLSVALYFLNTKVLQRAGGDSTNVSDPSDASPAESALLINAEVRKRPVPQEKSATVWIERADKAVKVSETHRVKNGKQHTITDQSRQEHLVQVNGPFIPAALQPTHTTISREQKATEVSAIPSLGQRGSLQSDRDRFQPLPPTASHSRSKDVAERPRSRRHRTITSTNSLGAEEDFSQARFISEPPAPPIHESACGVATATLVFDDTSGPSHPKCIGKGGDAIRIVGGPERSGDTPLVSSTTPVGSTLGQHDGGNSSFFATGAPDPKIPSNFPATVVEAAQPDPVNLQIQRPPRDPTSTLPLQASANTTAVVQQRVSYRSIHSSDYSSSTSPAASESDEDDED